MRIVTEWPVPLVEKMDLSQVAELAKNGIPTATLKLWQLEKPDKYATGGDGRSAVSSRHSYKSDGTRTSGQSKGSQDDSITKKKKKGHVVFGGAETDGPDAAKKNWEVESVEGAPAADAARPGAPAPAP